LLRPYHAVHGIDLVETLSMIDYGDLPVAPGDTEGTYRRIEAALEPAKTNTAALAPQDNIRSLRESA